MTRAEIQRVRFVTMVDRERDRQDELHPRGMYSENGYVSRDRAMVVLMEEVGELAEAILEGDREQQITEVTHVAAVCSRMFEEVL